MKWHFSAEINKLLLREVHMYDMERDYRPSILTKDNDSMRFILELIFDRFDPYYEIEFKKAKWEKEGLEEALEINAKSIYVKNKDQVIMYLNFDDVDTEIRFISKGGISFFAGKFKS